MSNIKLIEGGYFHETRSPSGKEILSHHYEMITLSKDNSYSHVINTGNNTIVSISTTSGKICQKGEKYNVPTEVYFEILPEVSQIIFKSANSEEEEILFSLEIVYHAN